MFLLLDIVCGVIPAGTSTETITDDAPYAHGTPYTYVCSAGTDYGGDKTTICNAGTWSLDPPPICSGKHLICK